MDACCTEIVNLCIPQGTTFSRLFTWTGPVYLQGVLQIGPINITGWTAVMKIKPYPLSTTVLYDASSNLTINGPLGQILLTIPAANTETFTWWTGIYDLVLSSSDGSYTTRLVQGKVTVSPGVST